MTCKCHYCSEVISIRGERDMIFVATGSVEFNGFIEVFSLDGITEATLEEVGKEGNYYHPSCLLEMWWEDDPYFMEKLMRERRR